MGKQLQLATKLEDEIELIQFIASLAPIRVFQSFACSPETLWLHDFNTNLELPVHLYIWPERFSWTPEYKQTGGPKCPKDRRGIYYIANKHQAPVFELSRSDLSKRKYGRIYWGSDFAAPHGLGYDKAAFSQLVDVVWRRIRKIGKKDALDSLSPYFLPHALCSRATEATH